MPWDPGCHVRATTRAQHRRRGHKGYVRQAVPATSPEPGGSTGCAHRPGPGTRGSPSAHIALRALRQVLDVCSASRVGKQQTRPVAECVADGRTLHHEHLNLLHLLSCEPSGNVLGVRIPKLLRGQQPAPAFIKSLVLHRAN